MSPSKQKKKIVFVSTARSDYNIMLPVMDLAEKDNSIKNFNICAGMHLVKEFGLTWKEFKKDNLKIDAKVNFLKSNDLPHEFAKQLGKGVYKFTDALQKLNPDIICVCGDRIENLSLYIAATTLKIPVAHILGGDETEGAIDNQIRHTMTKLSHVHFVSMPLHAKRVMLMGEEKWRVIISGNPAIDLIKKIKLINRNGLYRKENINKYKNICLVIYHPQTLGKSNDLIQFKNILSSISKKNIMPILVQQNIDLGFKKLSKYMNKFHQDYPNSIIKTSFDKESYYSIMNECKFMIGNSSSGILEAASFSLPVINVGDRQKSRFKPKNVFQVSGMDVAEIDNIIDKVSKDTFKDKLKNIKNPYGNGDASNKIIEFLKNLIIDDSLLTKKFQIYKERI